MLWRRGKIYKALRPPSTCENFSYLQCIAERSEAASANVKFLYLPDCNLVCPDGADITSSPETVCVAVVLALGELARFSGLCMLSPALPWPDEEGPCCGVGELEASDPVGVEGLDGAF